MGLAPELVEEIERMYGFDNGSDIPMSLRNLEESELRCY